MCQFSSKTVLDKLTLEFISKNPILAVGAMFFSLDRQITFKSCYRSMRDIDDIVDDIKEKNNGEVPEHLRDTLENTLSSWIESVRNNHSLGDNHLGLIKLLEMMDIPLWPWEKLVDAMIYDLSQDRKSVV